MNRKKNHSERPDTQASRLGRIGEIQAAEFLKVRGYSIAAMNFKTPIGRNRKGVALTGEIDIVAVKGNTVCFVEVKTRSDDPAPQSAVNLRKQRQITRASRNYLKVFNLGNKKVRYDVISIVARKRRAPQITHFEGFWSPRK